MDNFLLTFKFPPIDISLFITKLPLNEASPKNTVFSNGVPMIIKLSP